jgi:hypothetical protein
LVIRTEARNSPSEEPKFLSDGTPYVPIFSPKDEANLASFKMSTESSEGSCESDVSEDNLVKEDIDRINKVFFDEADRALTFVERKKGMNRRKHNVGDYYK